MMRRHTDGVVITGVGFGTLGRDTGRTEGQLAVEACREAIADAGLSREDIDGLSATGQQSSPPTSFQNPALSYVQRSLALSNLRLAEFTGGSSGHFGCAFLVASAILAGTCEHALIYRAHKRQNQRLLPNLAVRDIAWHEDAFTMPYGAGGGAPRLAMWAARYMYEYGTSPNELAAVVCTAREHGSTNPRAYWQNPITVEEYLASPWIAPPFRILDCDYPIDGAVALVLSSREAAERLERKPVYVESIGHGGGPDLSWLGWRDLTAMASAQASRNLWNGTELTHEDVNFVEPYDGFSWLALCWMEDLGFVPKGSGGEFFEKGHGRLGGTLPVLTDGGQLGMGRLHGMGKLAQAVLQLRGEAGANQVAGARVGIACAGGGPSAGAILLTSDPV